GARSGATFVGWGAEGRSGSPPPFWRCPRHARSTAPPRRESGHSRATVPCQSRRFDPVADASPTFPSIGRRSRNCRFIFELETDFLQAFQRGLAVLVLDFLGHTRRIGDGVNLLVGFLHDHDQQPAEFVGNVAEATVLAAGHRNHVERLQYERLFALIAPSNLKATGKA